MTFVSWIFLPFDQQKSVYWSVTEPIYDVGTVQLLTVAVGYGQGLDIE